LIAKAPGMRRDRHQSPPSVSRLQQWGRRLFGGVAVVALLGLGVVVAWGDGAERPAAPAAATSTAIPLAVIGDSTSHSYQDRLAFPAGTPERGGAFHAQTFQWTEVLARLRGTQLDLGPWVERGQPGNIALARELIGLPTTRAPRKQDYLYNFANSGAACKNVMGDQFGQRFRQVPRLVKLMDQAPERWRRGVVVFYIGGNNWNGLLDLQASDPAAPQLRQTIDYCTQQIRAGIALIHASHPLTRILLVSLVNQADDPANLDSYRSATAMANIDKALGDANAQLRKIAEADPQRIAFADLNEWFTQRWGQRGPHGEPDYKTVAMGPRLRVTNTGGDAPSNTVLLDGHWGVVPNAIWAQSFVARLREAFGLPLTPITDEELTRFLSD